ncbi:MAG: hypothetical protein ABIO91_06795 [Pyrinomonadaceae bacterium]
MVIKKLGKWEISEDELERMFQQSSQLGRDVVEASASKFTFDRKDRSIRIELPGNALLTFPASNIKELVGATDDEIEQGELIAQGTLLRWSKFNADYSIEGFTHGRYGTQAWMQALGRMGGQSKSPAKVAASRMNGQKGGRPPRGLTEALPYPMNLVGASEPRAASLLSVFSAIKTMTVRQAGSLNSMLSGTATTNLIWETT